MQYFIDECLEKTNECTITISELYENMRIWHSSNYGGRCPNKSDFHAYMQTMINDIKELNCMQGYKIKDQIDFY
jgi:hypothetical protein